MGLNVGNSPVTAVYVGSTPVTAVYVGAEKIWPTWPMVVQITLGAGTQARDQLRAALADRGLDYKTVTEIPFDIELAGTGSVQYMFEGCSALTHAPALDTAQVTDMRRMFEGCSSLTNAPAMDTPQVTDTAYMFSQCSSLTHVPDMDTSQNTYLFAMFWSCSSLTDGNVRLIGRHPNAYTAYMIDGSGLTREPFYTTDGQPWPTAEVYEVSLTDVSGGGTAHPLLTVTVPAGETWSVRIQGTITKARASVNHPNFRIGTTNSGTYAQGASVDFSGSVTSADATIAMITMGVGTVNAASFVGTVTIEK